MGDGGEMGRKALEAVFPEIRGQCEVVEAVRADLLQRSQAGIRKYGVTMADAHLSLRQWLQHAYEECLDQAAYLKAAIQGLDNEGR